MNRDADYRAALARYLPEVAVDWALSFIKEHGVHFRITRDRSSKLGDYRGPYASHPYHEISVNGGLRPEMFLWVLLHEAAHLDVRLTGKKVQPHGHEWQMAYARRIMECIEMFGTEVHPMIAQYAARIPLNRALGQQIEQRLKGQQDRLRLNDLQPGMRFGIASQPARVFEAVAKRRTRWECIEVNTGARYLVGGQMEVTLV